MQSPEESWYKRVIARLRDEFVHHPLGATYYFFAILVGIEVVVSWLINYFKATQSPIADHLWYLSILILGIVILQIPILALKIHRSRTPGQATLNPTLRSLGTSFHVDVSKTTRHIVRRDNYRAVDETPNVLYRFRLTGIPNLAVKLIEPSTARLTGPVLHHDYVLYQVEFDHPIKANDTREVCLCYDVDDPNCTMKPYHAFYPGNLNSVALLETTLRFPKDRPQNVVYEINDVGMAPIKGKIGDLFPDEKGEYNVTFTEVVKSNTYTISWSW